MTHTRQILLLLLIINSLVLNSKCYRLLCRHSYCRSNNNVQLFYKSFQSYAISNRLCKYNTRLYDTINKTYIKRTSSNEVVVDDFGQICEALLIYKQVYNDMDITNKFEVPEESPWPPHLHGLRLGKRLQKLLSTPEFFQNYPELVDELARHGFDHNVHQLLQDWDLIVKGLKCYRKLNGDLRISARFIVPSEEPWPRIIHGLKLGIRVAAIRSAGRYVKDKPERKQLLEDLEFEWRLRDNTYSQQVGKSEFDEVVEALKIYKKHVDSSLLVPVTFVVPSEDPWPERLHGFKLGSIVQAITNDGKFVYGHSDRTDTLTKLGFKWEEVKGRSVDTNNRFNTIFDALTTYRSIHGDLLVPHAFIVPSEEPWPEATWGLKLGLRVSSIRNQGTFIASSPERRIRLDSIGFCWELPSEVKRRKKKSQDPQQIEETDATDESAAQWGPKSSTYSLDISPTDNEAPLNADSMSVESDAAAATASAQDILRTIMGESEQENAESISAAAAARRIRNLETTTDSLLRLPYDPSYMFAPDPYREVAGEAMLNYLMSRDYSEDPDVRQTGHFEGQVSPYEFGRAVARYIPPEKIKMLKNIGYRIMEFGKFNWGSFMDALTTYTEVYGNSNVPEDFVISEAILDKDLGFSEDHLDMPLGELVTSVRIGDVDGLEDTTRRRKLDALGFDWGDVKKYQRFRFPPMYQGLKVYRHLYGFPLPQHNFVVPDEPQWPYWMVNMPLGEWASIARVQQQMLFEEYPERVDMLNGLEFLWWLPPGSTFPAKYYKPLRIRKKKVSKE